MARDLESTNEFIDKMERRVSNMEDDAMRAIKERGQTIATTIVKAGVGVNFLYDAATYNGNGPEYAIAIIAGLSLVGWGIRDAGQIPERFRRARDLVTNSRLLRATLTSNIADTIQGIPFRRLEESDTPSLPTAQSSLNHNNKPLAK